MTNASEYIDVEQQDPTLPLQALLGPSKGPLAQSLTFLVLAILATRWFSYVKKKSQAIIRRSLPSAWILSHQLSATSSTLRSVSSSSSSTSLSESESAGSDSSDDLLEAVSLLFQEEGEDACFGSGEKSRDTGTIIARLIPENRTGFDEKKPLAYRRDDAHLLRRILEEANEIPTVDCGDKWEDFSLRDELLSERIVDLQVRLWLSPESAAQMTSKKGGCDLEDEGFKYQRLDMRLMRDAREPARKTLRRLHLSIARKLGCGIHGGHAYLKSKAKQDPNVFLSHREVNAQREQNLSTEPSVWVRESSSLDVTNFDDEEEETAAVDSFTALQRQKSSSQRQLHLNNGSSAPSLPSPTIEMDSACLWNELAEYEGSCLYFAIHSSGPLLLLEVDACPPTILSIDTFERFQARLYVGVPIAVQPILLHAACAHVAWFIERGKDQQRCIKAQCLPASNATSSYTPVDDDIGKSISVLVAPMRPGHDGKGYEEAFRFRYVVEPLPPLPLVSPLRDAWTTDRQPLQRHINLRVLTYNLLADWYAGRTVEACKTSRKNKPAEGFYTFCDGEFLVRSRRFPMLVSEILSYQPDLICLQEVDAAIFDLLLMPVLGTRGYQGYYSNKASAQSEGCAMFWSLQAFERTEADDMHEFHLSNFFQECPSGGVSDSGREGRETSWEECTGSIERLLESNKGLREVVTSKVGQVVQIASLQPRCHGSNTSDRPNAIVVGNTHLFYHPLAHHVRVIQAYQVGRYLETVRQKASIRGRSTSMILCGDFNSHPLSGAVQLLLNGRLGSDHFEAWKNLNLYSWEMGEEEYLLEHGYIGDNVDEDNDPTYIDESFEDANEGVGEDTWETKETSHGQNTELTPTQDQVKGINIHFPSTFPHLISGYPEMPEFTNFSIGFAETLDYILASEPSATEEFGFQPVDAAPLPTIADMHDYTAMPNEFMPSDHVSLVCDLAWVHH